MGKFSITGTYVYRNCKYCGHKTNSCSLSKHEKHCYLNPDNKKLCPVCDEPIKNWKTSTTCSYGCANTYFRSGKDNPNYGNITNPNSSYTIRKTCFEHHKRECVICGEKRVVAVHHLDNNNKNNDPSNLIPLCPTHHTYWHSGYRHLIEDKILNYMEKWRSEWQVSNLRTSRTQTARSTRLSYTPV